MRSGPATTRSTGCGGRTSTASGASRRARARSRTTAPRRSSVPAMLVAIAGGHGKIALRLTRLLSARGDRVRSLIRNPDHAGDVREAGAEPVVCDLEAAGEDEVAEAVAGSDAVVFGA